MTMRHTVLGTVQTVNGAANLSLTPADAAKLGGHPVTAVYSGSAGFSASTSNTLVLPALANAAGWPFPGLAAEELVSLFGSNWSKPPSPPSPLRCRSRWAGFP